MSEIFIAKWKTLKISLNALIFDANYLMGT